MSNRLVDLGATTAPVSDREKRIWHVYGCESGTIKKLRARDVAAGKILSCGCLRRERIGGLRRSHGRTISDPTYGSWSAMHARCRNKNSTHYASYGGRGISICPRWYSFELFLEDMGERPEGKTLDRKNNDESYNPDNCRWASNEEQHYNRQDTLRFAWNGRMSTIAELASLAGVSKSALYSRLQSYGWTIERAMTTPARRSRRWESIE